MQFKRPKRTPLFLALAVLALVGTVRVWNPDFIDRAERMTYDVSVRRAQNVSAPAATNLAFVSMEDSSIAAINDGKVNGLGLGYHSGLYWQRHIYGRLVNELATQGAQCVAFDVLLGELRTDHSQVQMAEGGLLESDEFFAVMAQRAGNVLLAATPDVLPPLLFATNVLALGDISTEKDSDGILRRVRAFREVRRWDQVIKDFAALPEIGGDLARAIIQPGKILVSISGTTNFFEIGVDAENNFQVADFVGDKLPAGMLPRAKAFTTQRVWHMGIVIAAQQLKLDLAKAEADLPQGRIVLTGAGGVTRVIPVDGDGFFYVDWRLTPDDSRLLRAPVEALLAQDRLRLLERTNGLRDDFRGKLVIVGSAAQGNDLTDRGATPLERNTLLVSKHWNVANSIITGQFIHRIPLAGEIVLILLLGGLTALITWELRAVAASVAVALLIALYFGAAVFAFTHFRWWLPSG